MRDEAPRIDSGNLFSSSLDVSSHEQFIQGVPDTPPRAAQHDPEFSGRRILSPEPGEFFHRPQDTFPYDPPLRGFRSLLL